MQIYLRIYRTHDHDLMALYQTNTVNIAQATKKAIIAYYTGEPLCISTKPSVCKDITQMPLKKEFIFNIEERDAIGITKWIQGIEKGYRNCLFKNILRHYLEDPGIQLFRDDSWEAKRQTGTEALQVIAVPVTPRKKSERELTGSEWVEKVASERIQPKGDKKISDLDELLKRKEDTNDTETLPTVSISERAGNMTDDELTDDTDADFDAFAEFQKIREGV